MLFATVPAAPPTRKNQRTTSWPAPISAKVPYQRGSRLIFSALEWVSSGSGGHPPSPSYGVASRSARQNLRLTQPPLQIAGDTAAAITTDGTGLSASLQKTT